MLLALSVPASNDRGPQYMEQALAALHAAASQRFPISLQYATRGEEITLLCNIPDQLASQFQRQVYAHYPDAKLTTVDADASRKQYQHVTVERSLFVTSDLFPLKRYPQFEDVLNRVTADPVAALFSTLASTRREGLQARIVLTLRPATAGLRKRREACLRRLSHAFFRNHPRLAALYRTLALGPWFLVPLSWLLSRLAGPQDAVHQLAITTSSTRLHDREEDLQAAGDKLGKLLFDASIALIVSGPTYERTKRKMGEIVSAFGTFAGRQSRFRMRRRRRWFVLSAEEVATLWHPPVSTVQAPNVNLVNSRDRAPPLQLPAPRSHPEMTLLGVTKFRSTWRKFGILPEDRFRHLAFLGKTGMGKSTVLQRLAASDIRAGRGVGIMDPHGDLIQDVLRLIPRHRTNDVILFDPADRSHPIAFNILDHRDASQRPLIASAVVSAFKKLYADSWGPRLEHIFRNAVLTLLEIKGASLVTLVRLLGNATFRKRVLRTVHNPAVRTFWHEEFGRKPIKFQEEAVAPIQNKIGHFVSSPILCNILGQAENKLDLRAIMDDGRILLVNLSKGRIGDDASQLLGSFLVTGLQLAAMSRADLLEQDRKPFYLTVDEFQNYATESFATILSEARKYRLALTIANQYLGQLDEATMHATFGNVGTLVSFQVGIHDAEVLAPQLGGDLEPRDLMTLSKYHAYVRLLLDGEPTPPFSMKTMPFQGSNRSNTNETIRRTSRHRYARPVAAVEKEIYAAFAAM